MVIPRYPRAQQCTLKALTPQIRRESRAHCSTSPVKHPAKYSWHLRSGAFPGRWDWEGWWEIRGQRVRGSFHQGLLRIPAGIVHSSAQVMGLVLPCWWGQCWGQAQPGALGSLPPAQTQRPWEKGTETREGRTEPQPQPSRFFFRFLLCLIVSL